MKYAYVIFAFSLGFAILASASKAPIPIQKPGYIPQTPPCTVIDERATTSVIRIIREVAKTDYKPQRGTKKLIFDRLPQ